MAKDIKWDEIKVAYITQSDSSLRKLAKQYGVSSSVIARRCASEGWKKQKDQFVSESVSKSLDAIMREQEARRARVEALADKLLAKLEKAIDELDLVAEAVKIKESTVSEGGVEIETTTERVNYSEGGVVDRAGAKQIAAAMKDLKDIQMLRSELDVREQAARVAILEGKSAQDDGSNVEVSFEDSVAESISV
ncbi:MAG: hypothetical protein IKT58_03145 [Oscillospiraceae bacterium]|nr:hypothetical protein [Oscillospiraceae bacterium]